MDAQGRRPLGQRRGAARLASVTPEAASIVRAASSRPAAFSGVPGMGVILEVQVLSGAGHSDRSEAQLRKGDRPWGGSVERNRGPTYRNRI
jgi:hypothetical protein